MTINKKRILLIISLLLLAIILICAPRFINVNSIHEYHSIDEFEKETQLSFYDLYDFEYFVQNHQKQLLRDESDFILHYDEENPSSYSYISNVNENNSYSVDFHFINTIPNHYNQVEQIGDSTLYTFTQDDNTKRYFIVVFNQLKYEFSFHNTNHLDDTYIIEKAKEYVALNQEYHNQ
jgi:hypothetical protein